MSAKESTFTTKPVTLDTTKTLLAIGPQPPPVGGATVLFQVFLDELSKYAAIQTPVINVRSPRSYRHKKLFGFESFQRTAIILSEYLKKIGHCDAVLVFGNNPFNLTIVPLLLGLARLYGKPFYLHPLGGGLDLFLAQQNKLLRNYLLKVLRAMDGVLSQTKLLQRKLIELGCENIYYMPDFRPLEYSKPPEIEASDVLRLIYFSQIKHLKGVFVLLEALRLIAEEDDITVTCDFYGPVFEEDKQEFFTELKRTPGTKYCGMAEVGTGSSIIRLYDVMILPTHHPTEGHPGVIIEAMQVGVPVISTNHRAIPELITDGENGLLVPPQSSEALAKAIKRIALDRSLQQQMGKLSYERGQEFRADVIVPQALKLIFPE